MDHLPENLNWIALKNAVSQIAGRLFLSLSRLLIAIMIVRFNGMDLFGQYTLVLSLLFVAEWIVDFGATQITVLGIAQSPDKEGAVLQALTLLKATQAVVAYMGLIVILFLLNFDPQVIRAGLIGGIGLIFYGGALVYRTLFKVHMTMQKDVGGEVIGVIVMIPLIWITSMADGSVEGLVVCYVISRIIFFMTVWLWGKKQFKLLPLKFERSTVRETFRLAWPIGIAGLIVAGYESIAPIMLSKLMGMEAVAQFSISMRFIFPVVIITQAVSGTFYPILAAYWQKQPDDFRDTQQNSLESSFIIACALFCAVNGGAEFLMGIVREDLVTHAYILRFLSLALLARTITAALHQVVVIAGGQSRLLLLAVVTVVTQIILIWLIVPVYGMTGFLSSYVAIEYLFSLIPTIFILRHMTHVRISWLPIIMSAVAVFIALAGCSIIGLLGSFWGAVFAMLLYFVVALLLRAISIKKLLRILSSIQNRSMFTGS